MKYLISHTSVIVVSLLVLIVNFNNLGDKMQL